MNQKILEQEAEMNRFKYETFLKFYFKNHKTNESKRLADGYTKGIMLLRPTNYGALLPCQEDISNSIFSRLTIKDILNKNVVCRNLFKKVYRDKFKIRKEANFRPLNRLILSEIDLKLKELQNE